MELAPVRIEAVPWLPLCIKQLGLQGLACLATRSKQLRHECGELVKSDAPTALLGTLEAAATARAEAAANAAGSPVVDRGGGSSVGRGGGSTMELNAVNGVINSLSWLLTKVATDQNAELLAMAAQHLVCLPDMPDWQAWRLCDAGVRISNTLLLEAAYSMVPGVEAWALAQRQLHRHTDITPAALEICRSESVDLGTFCLQNILKQAAPEDLPGLLQLANNCKHLSGSYVQEPVTAVAAMNSLPAELEPAVARRLLVTAAARHGAGITSSLIAKESIRQHIDPATFEAVTTQLLAAKMCMCTAAVSKSTWWQLPAAVELTSAAVGRLLQAVVNQPVYLMPCGSLQCVEQLCSLPGAERLSCNSLESLLQDACQRRTLDCVPPLFALPAAREIGTDLIVQLLLAAAQRGGCHNLGEKLRELPADELFSSDIVVQLLTSALQHEYTEDALFDVKYLKGLQAAKRVSSGDIAHVMALASTCGRVECVALLQDWADERAGEQ